jgi:hypothetical protein
MLDPPAIDICRVKKIDPQLKRPLHDPKAFLFGGHPAEIHRTQTQIADEGSMLAQPNMLHCHFTFLLGLI